MKIPVEKKKKANIIHITRLLAQYSTVKLDFVE